MTELGRGDGWVLVLVYCTSHFCCGGIQAWGLGEAPRAPVDLDSAAERFIGNYKRGIKSHGVC